MTERDIFVAAIEVLDPAERERYVRRACGGNLVLQGKVEALLRSHESAGSFLGTPAVAPPNGPSASDSEATWTSEGGQESPPDLESLSFLAPSSRSDSLGRIGHYEVLQVLGKGGFGIVLRAFDDILQRVVALKVLAPSIASTSPARKRFLREARSSAAVRHENVVQVYEVAEQPLPYLAMEFIPGETLQQRLNRTGPLDVPEVLRIGQQIAEGLAAAHANDLIHRDIKPGNVLIEGGQQKVKITDFGLARAADDASISQSGLIAGTPMYMAPEQARGDTLDHRADLFSLGSVLYQMVTGRPPFRANSTVAVLKRVAEDRPRPIREIIPETPEWLCDIIARLHAKDPADRYQSAREVADLLAACEERVRAGARPSSVIVPLPGNNQRPARRKWAAVIGVLACLVAGALAVYALNRPATQPSDDKGVPTGPVGLVSHPNPVEPVTTPDPAADRRAAVYVLSIGGDVKVNGTDEFLGTVDRLPKTDFTLTQVYLRDNKKVTDDGLAFFRGCREVKHLDLVGTGVTDAGLANFKDCRNLTVIDLFSTNVSDVGLEHLKRCRGLTYLVLRSTRVTDATAARFGTCADLAKLSLAHTQVTDAGLVHFRNCTKIKHLDLDALPITDAGLSHFQSCRSLEVLSLGGTRVTDVGLAWLKGCKHLRVLFLHGTQVTAAAVEDLRTALPKCRIEWTGGVIEPAAEPLTDAELRRIAALPAPDQVEEVRKELKQRNPGYGGTLNPTIEDGVITRLEIDTFEVADIAPVRALPGLKTLVCYGTEGLGKLADLSPLKGMSLTTLDCNNNGKLTDLSPLKGMGLKRLFVQHTGVRDLAPLAGMRLEDVNCSHSPVADLTPLKGMPLIVLYLDGTHVTDLSPLRGMPLKLINLRNVRLNPERDGAILRSLDRLEEINSEPAAEFLMKLEAR